MLKKTENQFKVEYQEIEIIDADQDNLSDELKSTIRLLEIITKWKVDKLIQSNKLDPFSWKKELKFILKNGKRYRVVEWEWIYEESDKLIAQ